MTADGVASETGESTMIVIVTVTDMTTAEAMTIVAIKAMTNRDPVPEPW